MSTKIEGQVRDVIMSRPDVILEDNDLMQALVSANDRAMGDNIIDMRGLAMDRLETRLNQLEDTHRSVIAAAYENLSSTNQIHRAALALLEAKTFEHFLADLNGPVAQILKVDAMRVVVETSIRAEEPMAETLAETFLITEPGFIDGFLTDGRGTADTAVKLRQIAEGDALVYGTRAPKIRSEGCLRLDLGNVQLQGLLVMGAEDAHVFGPQQGTDLLAFFGGVFERTMRRWFK
ncbi:MAG: DUF484 family protein [Pseudomonadota bacterium]